MYKLKDYQTWPQLIVRGVMMIGSAILLTYILQAFQLQSLTKGRLWFGQRPTLACATVLLLLVMHAGLTALCNRFWYGTALHYLIVVVFAFSNYQKVLFRDMPILPSDLALLNDATSLVKMVSVKQIILLAVILILGIVGAIILQRRFKRPKGLPLPLRLIVLASCGVVIFGFFSMNHPKSISYKVSAAFHNAPDFWDPITGANINGPLLSFVNNLDTEIMTKPKDYNQKTIQKLVQRYQKTAQQINQTRPNTNINRQTVIYVLSESFSDPTRVPNLKVNTDPIPNIRRIKQQTTSGLMLSSGYGGGTANMEYMTDTSSALSFFSPTLPTPYTQLVPNQKVAPNITNLFKTKNAIHTYVGNFYRRTTVYKKFGFQTFRNTQTTGKLKLKYAQKIQKSDLIGDDQAYKDVLWQVHQQKSGQFISLVTMQNHMPYWRKYNQDQFKVSGSATGANQEQIENYTEGISLTDQSTAAFLKQLDQIKKPITVLWYGDHLAGIYAGDTMSKYNIPLHETDYFIYSNRYARQHGANQKIKQATHVVSPNTFSALVLAQMKQKVSPYYALITKVQQQLPAMALDVQGNKQGLWVDQTGKRVDQQNLTAQQKRLYHDYRLIQYDLTAGKQYVLKTHFIK